MMPLPAILSISEIAWFSSFFAAALSFSMVDANLLERAAELRTVLAVALAVHQALPVRLQRGSVSSQNLSSQYVMVVPGAP